MNRIEQLLNEYSTTGKKCLNVFITAGFPDINITGKLLAGLSEYADIIELGIPFSDPVADGPSIQYSSQKALETGITLSGVLSLLRKKKNNIVAPVVLMSYLNPVYSYGLKNFFRAAAASGVGGVIFPDVPYEESIEMAAAARKNGIAFIPLVSLTTPVDRAVRIASSSNGFVYVTAVTGVTGVRSTVSAELIPFLKKLKSRTDKPVFVGFGISMPEHITNLKNYCDGFIIGSAVVDRVAAGKPIVPFLKKMRQALD